jgi:hypothetical protein
VELNARHELTLPEALAEAFAIGFAAGWDEAAEPAHGYDFGPYEAFEAPEQTAGWFRAWTGNPESDGGEFRFFGVTGGGDYTGFWLIRPEAPIAEQPIVHLGSEGQRNVVARNLGELLWLFAAGYGPAEAVAGRHGRREPNDALRTVAERHAPGKETSAKDIIEAAQAAYPYFSDYIDALCDAAE